MATQSRLPQQLLLLLAPRLRRRLVNRCKTDALADRAACDFTQQSIKDKRFVVCCRVLDVRKSTELSGAFPGGRFHANRDQVSLVTRTSHPLVPWNRPPPIPPPSCEFRQIRAYAPLSEYDTSIFRVAAV